MLWLRAISGVSAAAVVAAVAYFSLRNDTAVRQTDMALVSASVPRGAITVEDSDGSREESATIALRSSQPTVDEQGIIRSSKESDYTHVRTEGIRHHIVSIPRGQVYKIRLSDGTEVWLNADSRLSFPTRFAGNRRTVSLEGEAYFRVAPDKNSPFVIVTDKMITNVLGTEFNIKAYKNAETHLTLVNGSVKVRLPRVDKEVTLTPGEDISCTDTEYRIKQVDTSYYVQWMAGYFYYDDVCLSDILSDLGHWYNLNIEMEQDTVLMNQRLHFIAGRDETVDRVVELLNMYEYLDVSRNGEKITVRKKR